MALPAQQSPAPPQMSYYGLAPINRELPRWLSFSGEYRARMEGFSNGGFRDGNEDAYLLSRFRVNMRVQPASWAKFFFQGQDARVYWKNQAPKAPPFQDSMDLRQAWLELGDAEKKTVAVRVGRQELVYGEQRLVGHVSWLNTARSFDAVLAQFHHGNVRLDAFAASVVNIRHGEFNRHADGNNFHGLYGKIDKIVPKGLLEPYLFWRVAPTVRGEGGAVGKLNFFTPGFRFVGTLPEGFDYSLEMAFQRGDFAADRVSAWAGHWRVGRVFSSLRFTPRLIAEYQHATGDDNARDGVHGTFDQLYPTPHDKIGLADQVGWRNVSAVRFGVEMKLTRKLLVTPNYHNIWLASRFDALYNVAGVAVARSAGGTAGRHVGQEVDLQLAYPLSKFVQLSGGYAYLFSGRFLKATTPGKNYSFPYLQVVYSF
jgi:hypothetical protein